MTMPAQASEALQVVVLFDEEVPEGVPIALGLMAYDISGGLKPYTFEWLQNGQVVGTDEVVVIKPAKGDSFTLRATDRNRCVSLHDFNMRVIQKSLQDSLPGIRRYTVYPTVISEEGVKVTAAFQESVGESELLMIDSRGSKLLSMKFRSEILLQAIPTAGVYYLVIRNGDYIQVEKVIKKSR